MVVLGLGLKGVQRRAIKRFNYFRSFRFKAGFHIIACVAAIWSYRWKYRLRLRYLSYRWKYYRLRRNYLILSLKILSLVSQLSDPFRYKNISTCVAAIWSYRWKYCLRRSYLILSLKNVLRNSSNSCGYTRTFVSTSRGDSAWVRFGLGFNFPRQLWISSFLCVPHRDSSAISLGNYLLHSNLVSI